MRRRQRALLQTLAAIAGAAAVLVYAWSYVAPFLFAVFLAAVIDPHVHRLRSATGIRRGTAVLLVLSAFLLVVFGAVALVIANLIVELERLLAHLPSYVAVVHERADVLRIAAGQLFADLPEPFNELFRFDSEAVARTATVVVRNAVGSLRGAPNALFFLGVSGLATFFISRDRHVLWSAVLNVLPAAWWTPLVRIRDEIVGGVLAMVRAQLILVGATTVLSVAGLALAGVPYAWLLGLMAGVFDLAPVVGPGAVFVPAALVYALSGQAATAVKISGLWLALVLARQLAEPYIFGVQLGLHPVTVLAAVYVGVKAAGLAGFLIGPLTLVVVKALLVVTVLGERPAS